MVTQLTLSGIQIKDTATFDSFSVGSNQQLLTALRASASNQGEHFIYMWGNSGAGRSHLLQACCHNADMQGLVTMYIPLQELRQLSPQILQDIELLSLICIDDIDCIAGNKEWEEAVFHLYNRVREANTRLIISAACPPRELSLSLPDLSSRLAASVIFQIHSLTDEEKVAALQLRGKARGMTISDEVGQFLLRRCPRNMNDLFSVLDKLDHATIAAKRRLTIPFIKSVLGM